MPLALHVEPAPALTPADLATRLEGAAGSYVLGSEADHPLASWVLAGAAPQACLRVAGNEAHLTRSAGGDARGDPFAALADLWGPPAPGGPPWPVVRAVGYLAYEFGALCDRFPRTIASPDVPQGAFARYDAGYVCDPRGSAWVWGERPGAARALKALLAQGGRAPARPRVGAISESPATLDEYVHALGRVLEYIRAGDIYQANLVRRFHASFEGSAAALWTAFAARSPSPFAAFLDLGGVRILSASPERFLYIDRASGLVETRPIKGTRPRGTDAGGDAAAARELAEADKDLAEHVMIVDLVRNDLGRVCRTGSVRVHRFAGVETFAQVHHLVSIVRGELHPRADLGTVLRATFPGGSITGAPKVRAMEIIAEVEGAPRGPCFGAFGYLDAFGRADLALAIRTAFACGGRLTYSAGGGIVADSDPLREHAESSIKAQAFLDAAAAFAV
jgi:para-aminobenzoate synthetase component 1